MDEKENQFITLYQCRYYNDVFGSFNDFKIPTSQTRNKVLKNSFKKMVIEQLEKIANKEWPYKERLTIAVNINGFEPYINRIDIDNVLKNLLDILKGRVFVDDKQIFSIMADKQINVSHGFLVGVRILNSKEFNETIPPFYSENEFEGFGDGPLIFWKSFAVSGEGDL